MSQPTVSIMIPAQQNFHAYDSLNPIQIEIEDNRIINILKIYKNVIYKVTPLGLLFPASVKSDTKQTFITGKELSAVKNSILNGKVYDLIFQIDLHKISNWKDIRRQSI